MKKMKKLVTTVTLAATILFSSVVPTSFDANAATGTWKNDSKGWWYEYSGGSYASNSWQEIDKKWYYFKSDGYMDAGGYRDGYWLNADGSWNTAYSGGKWASNTYGWWYTDSSGWYPKAQWLQIDGSWYYFQEDGYLLTNSWIDGYYLDENGVWIPGKEKNSGAWADAYKAEIEKYASKNKETAYTKIRFSLIYLDNDEIPELVCCKTGSSITVYTYYNNKATCIIDEWGYGAGGNAGYDYGPRTGIVANGNSDMAGALHYTTYWKLEKGELKQTEYYLCTAMFDYKKYGADWNHASDGDYHYYKILTSSKGKKSNYQEVTKSEYNKLQLDASEYISGNMSKDEILSSFK